MDRPRNLSEGSECRFDSCLAAPFYVNLLGDTMSEVAYEVDESNSSPRFLNKELMKEEYPSIFETMEKYDATFLNVANYRKGGVAVKTCPIENVAEKELETL